MKRRSNSSAPGRGAPRYGLRLANRGRGEELRRCPSCGAWFRWRLTYEFYVNGSEDEETLTSLSEEDAAGLRAQLTR